jgi:iron complex transport system substrate-binding protein
MFASVLPGGLQKHRPRETEGVIFMSRHILQLASVVAFAVAGHGAEAQVSFTDHRNKTIELDAPPERLVSVIPSGPIVYFGVDGGAEHIAGVNESSYKTFTTGFHGELLPELLERLKPLAGEGFVPNVEAVLEGNPDLVLQWTFDPGIIEPLERVGLKVVGWDCCTEAHRRDYLLFSGYISGRIDRAQMLLKLQDESNAAMRGRFADLAPEKLVSMLEVDKLQDQIQVVANSSQDYALSGVKNLAADDSGEWWRTIDAEQFLAWNPQIVIIPAWEPELTPAAFYDNELLASVDAIKNRRVYKVPKFNRSPDAAEVYLTAVWLAAIAHPETAEGNFRERVKEAYRTIYGKEVSDSQVDRVLEMDANKDSSRYAELFG